MPDPLLIEIRGNNAPWAAAVSDSQKKARQLADAQGREAARAAKEIQRQAKLSADFAEKQRQREIRDAIRAFDQIARANVREAARARKAAEQSLAAQEKATARTTARIEREAQKQAAAQIAEQRRWEKANVISFGTLQAAGYRYQDRLARDAEKAAAARARAAAKAARAEKQEFDKSRGVAMQLVGSIHSIAGEFALLDVGQRVLSAISENFSKARDEAYDSARMVRDYRESLLELAALKDRLGGTTTETKEQLLFRGQTLQSAEAAKSFQLAMLGSGESAINSNLIQRPAFDELMVRAGQFQAVEGGDAATHGRIAGMLPQITGGKLQTADELFQKELQLYAIMKPGGFKSASQGIEQLLNVSKYSDLYGGGAEGIANEAALLSALSTTAPDKAGTLVEQFTRATAASVGKMRGVKVEGDSQKIAEYMKGLKVDASTDPIEIGKRIALDMGQARDTATTTGTPFNEMDYLLHKGYGNVEDRDALIQFGKLFTSGQFDKDFMRRAGSATGLLPEDMARPGFLSPQQRIENWRHADPLADARRQETMKAAADAARGMGPMERYTALEQSAFEALRANPGSGVGGEFKDWQQSIFQGGKGRLDEKLMEAMVAEARAHGLDASKKYADFNAKTGEAVESSAYYDFGGGLTFKPGHYSLMEKAFGPDEGARAKRISEIEALVGSKGGNVSDALQRETLAWMKRAAESSERLEKLMEKGAKQVNPPVAPARPAPAMNR